MIEGMKLWLWAMVLAIATELAAMSSKKSLQIKKKNFISTNNNKSKQASSIEIINQVWTKIKRLIKAIYDKTFWTIARFFDGKRSYTLKLFGKTIRIVMPRMPHSGKEFQKQLDTIEKLIRQNPTDRCLAVIYVNIAIFVIGYTILFTYNIYCYFRYRRAWIAERNGQMIFTMNHSMTGLNSSGNLSSSIRKAAIAAHQASINLSVSPVGTILEEEEEMIRGETVKESTAKKSSVDGFNKVNPEISLKRELSMIGGATSLERISDLEEGLLSIPELFDDSNETSFASWKRIEDRNSSSQFINSGNETENFLRPDENYDCNIIHHGNSSKLYTGESGRSNFTS